MSDGSTTIVDDPDGKGDGPPTETQKFNRFRELMGVVIMVCDGIFDTWEALRVGDHHVAMEASIIPFMIALVLIDNAWMWRGYESDTRRAIWLLEGRRAGWDAGGGVNPHLPPPTWLERAPVVRHVRARLVLGIRGDTAAQWLARGIRGGWA